MDQGGDNTNCVNYPTKQYKTFADCDQNFVQRLLPQNFKPFWSQDPDNLDGVTTKYDLKKANIEPNFLLALIGFS